MTMYASKTPRDLNSDPYPNVWNEHTPHNQMRADTDIYRKGAPYRYPGYSHKPRPEYDHLQHNEPNPILVEFRESTLSLDVWLTHLTTSGRMHHGTFMTGAGTPPLCSCGWQGKNFTGPILAQHQREARAHVDHARRVLTRLAALA